MKLTVVLTIAALASAAAPKTSMTVYKTKTCGCCVKWVEHMQAAGFMVTVQDVESTAEARKANGIPDRLASCHTATVKGYVVEGHVPAADVKKLLLQRPAAKGLAAPGMPMGSPGMEGPTSQKYSVLLLDRSGQVSVFQKH